MPHSNHAHAESIEPSTLAADKPRLHAVVSPADSAPIDYEGALRQLGGDQELLQLVLSVMKKECPEHVELARQALLSGDAPGLARIAHRLRGMSLNVHAKRAAAACANLEQVARDGLPGDFFAAFLPMERELALAVSWAETRTARG
ncbi:MAG: Hpt domain-containing protein [Deltaproteobacteria bacterium]|nr:Hpt domain-containing protein [Deltaproteobacteria bacterium]